MRCEKKRKDSLGTDAFRRKAVKLVVIWKSSESFVTSFIIRIVVESQHFAN